MREMHPQQKVPRSIMRVRGRLRKEFEAGFDAPEVFTCQPQGPQDTKMKTRLEGVERLLTTIAAHESGVGFIVGDFDKARLSPINNLGRKDGAGDAVLRLTIEFIEHAFGLITSLYRKHGMSVELNRVSSTSDEVKMVAMGRSLPKDIKVAFEEAWRFLRQRCDLREQKYAVVAGYDGKREQFELDLDAFSRILKHPGIMSDPTRRDDLLLSYHLSFSKPRAVRADMKPGFVMDAFRELENEQISFRPYLPSSFRVNGGMAEIRSGFNTTVWEMFSDEERKAKADRMDGGTYVEVKLSPRDMRDLAALAQFINDGWGERYRIPKTQGTRKALAEVNSGRFGVRGLNTFLEKAGANFVITPVASAMWKFSQMMGVDAMPISGNFLQWWVNVRPDESFRRMITNIIKSEMESYGSDDYAVRRLLPSLVMLDATEMTVSDVRAKFVLASLNEGKELFPAEVLGQADFILNFMENVNREVQMSIYESLARKENGAQPISALDTEYINYVRWICSQRRTIRDVEDLVWVLRKDTGLPDDIKGSRKDLERWIFDFARERGDRIFYLLTKRIYKEIKNRR